MAFSSEEILEEFNETAGALRVERNQWLGMHTLTERCAVWTKVIRPPEAYDRLRYLKNLKKNLERQSRYYFEVDKARRQERARLRVTKPMRHRRSYRTTFNDALAITSLVALGVSNKETGRLVGISDTCVPKVVRRGLWHFVNESRRGRKRV